MEVDIACVGFGPAMGGFLTTLTQAWSAEPRRSRIRKQGRSRHAAAGALLRARRRSSPPASAASSRAPGAFAQAFPRSIPPKSRWPPTSTSERVLYLLDPIGASRRSRTLRVGRHCSSVFAECRVKDHAFELPWTPAFLHKHGGLVLSIGQFNQWVRSQLMASGLVQIWPGTPVAAPLFDERRRNSGVRLADQGVDNHGVPTTASCPAWMCARD